MGHRVTPIVHKAVGLRARSPCWRTAAYNLSWQRQKLFTWHTATLRTRREAQILICRCCLTSGTRQTEVLGWGVCVFSIRVDTPSSAAFYFWKRAPDSEEPGSWERSFVFGLRSKGAHVSRLSGTLIFWFCEAWAEWNKQLRIFMLVQSELEWFGWEPR